MKLYDGAARRKVNCNQRGRSMVMEKLPQYYYYISVIIFLCTFNIDPRLKWPVVIFITKRRDATTTVRQESDQKCKRRERGFRGQTTGEDLLFELRLLITVSPWEFICHKSRDLIKLWNFTVKRNYARNAPLLMGKLERGGVGGH